MPHLEKAQADANRCGGVLNGVRILDMATFLAAPFAATLCADLGAEVVKIELPSGPDPLRSLAPVKGKHSIHWKISNRGKDGITLDVRKPEGRALLLRLLPSFDVLVENFRTGTLDSWGLDLATLHAANPRLIVLRVTGFGQTGPDARRPGFARIFEAMSGFAHLIGEPTGSPQHMNYALGDMIAGLFGAFSITAALAEHARRPEAPGREIDLSATEAMFRLLETCRPNSKNWASFASEPVPAPPTLRRRTSTGRRTTSGCPSSLHPTRSSSAFAARWNAKTWSSILALQRSSFACGTCKRWTRRLQPVRKLQLHLCHLGIDSA
jgi:crotonobetainyl-CoA:carnitine CoA-transferase CaiB-like acyl-CoA transferase